MTLDGQQVKLLKWVEAKQPVIGIFHVMTDIKPMIDGGYIENRPVPRQKGQLLLTDAGKALLSETAH